MIDIIPQALYFLSTIAAIALVVHKRTPIRFAITAGYMVFSVLYILDIAYHDAIGYIAWSVINFALFYEIVKADKHGL